MRHNLSAPRSAFWLFAYGSLMWQPNFRFAERRRATLAGYHRALCVYSWVYRGTQEEPGLVFGLERGGVTNGVAFRVRGRDARDVYAAVYAREMVTAVYRPVWTRCRLPGDNRGTVTALAFVANPNNQQYAGRKPESEILQLINQGQGCAGPCSEYVINTLRHLRDIGIRDRALERLAEKIDC